MSAHADDAPPSDRPSRSRRADYPDDDVEDYYRRPARRNPDAPADNSHLSGKPRRREAYDASDEDDYQTRSPPVDERSSKPRSRRQPPEDDLGPPPIGDDRKAKGSHSPNEEEPRADRGNGGVRRSARTHGDAGAEEATPPSRHKAPRDDEYDLPRRPRRGDAYDDEDAPPPRRSKSTRDPYDDAEPPRRRPARDPYGDDNLPPQRKPARDPYDEDELPPRRKPARVPYDDEPPPRRRHARDYDDEDEVAAPRRKPARIPYDDDLPPRRKDSVRERGDDRPRHRRERPPYPDDDRRAPRSHYDDGYGTDRPRRRPRDDDYEDRGYRTDGRDHRRDRDRPRARDDGKRSNRYDGDKPRKPHKSSHGPPKEEGLFEKGQKHWKTVEPYAKPLLAQLAKNIMDGKR